MGRKSSANMSNEWLKSECGIVRLPGLRKKRSLPPFLSSSPWISTRKSWKILMTGQETIENIPGLEDIHIHSLLIAKQSKRCPYSQVNYINLSVDCPIH